MNNQKEDGAFNRELSIILIGGVSLSFLTEVIGIALYAAQTGSLTVDFSSQWQLTSSSFFTYVTTLFSSLGSGSSAIRLMALGIVVLMLTPYVRVIASAIHFSASRNEKYLFFTIFVFMVLTLSLAF
jgi:uncharacterized membrane protein